MTEKQKEGIKTLLKVKDALRNNGLSDSFSNDELADLIELITEDRIQPYQSRPYYPVETWVNTGETENETAYRSSTCTSDDHNPDGINAWPTQIDHAIKKTTGIRRLSYERSQEHQTKDE